MLKNDLVVALSEMDYYKNQAGAVINDVFHVIARTGGSWRESNNSGIWDI